jgi:hypothetical protein
MAKFRTKGPDVLPPERKKVVDKGVDALPDNRVPIYDHKGRMRGHVGHKASSATVSRFIGLHGAKLGKKDGRDAWLGPKPPAPKKPKVDPTAVAVAETQAKHGPQEHKVSIEIAKGSVSKNPTKPQTSARPKR